MLPTLHLHQMQQRSKAEFKTAGRLLPFLLLGAADSTQAAQQYRDRFGVEPDSVEGGQWQWRAEIMSLEHSLFGSPGNSRLPSFFEQKEKQQGNGLFRDLAGLQLRFRFVDEGVRVMLKLTPRGDSG